MTPKQAPAKVCVATTIPFLDFRVSRRGPKKGLSAQGKSSQLVQKAMVESERPKFLYISADTTITALNGKLSAA